MIPNMNAGMLIGVGGKRITVVNSTTSNPSGSSTSIAISVPSGVQSNDLLVVFFIGVNTWTPPAGWTKLVDSSNVCVAYKIASGSEPASYTFTHSTSVSAGIMVALRNAALDVTGTVAGSLTAPSVTLTQSKSMLLGFFAGVTSSAFTAPSGMTSVASASGDADAALFKQYPMVAGATGTRTASATGSSPCSILLGIKPS